MINNSYTVVLFTNYETGFPQTFGHIDIWPIAVELRVWGEGAFAPSLSGVWDNHCKMPPFLAWDIFNFQKLNAKS